MGAIISVSRLRRHFLTGQFERYFFSRLSVQHPAARSAVCLSLAHYWGKGSRHEKFQCPIIRNRNDHRTRREAKEQKAATASGRQRAMRSG
jgi:hypothetical protein